MIPHAGQRNWLRSNRSGIGGVKWFEEKAEFKFDPDQFYLLRYGTPYELRHPFYGLIFWLLGLTAIILAVNFLIWQASMRTANPKDPRLKR
jgi:hypothetical protein